MTQSVSQVRQCKNIQKNRLSRGKRFVEGACPYFFVMSLLILFENQQDKYKFKKTCPYFFWDVLLFLYYLFGKDTPVFQCDPKQILPYLQASHIDFVSGCELF